MKKECRKCLASKQSKQGGSQPKANVAEHTEQKKFAFYTFMAKRPANHVKFSARYIDSSASRHFTHRRDWFTEYMPFTNSMIFGGREEHILVGKGTCRFNLEGGI